MTKLILYEPYGGMYMYLSTTLSTYNCHVNWVIKYLLCGHSNIQTFSIKNSECLNVEISLSLAPYIVSSYLPMLQLTAQVLILQAIKVLHWTSLPDYTECAKYFFPATLDYNNL